MLLDDKSDNHMINPKKPLELQSVTAKI